MTSRKIKLSQLIWCLLHSQVCKFIKKMQNIYMTATLSWSRDTLRGFVSAFAMHLCESPVFSIEATSGSIKLWFIPFWTGYNAARLTTTFGVFMERNSDFCRKDRFFFFMAQKSPDTVDLNCGVCVAICLLCPPCTGSGSMTSTWTFPPAGLPSASNTQDTTHKSSQTKHF